METIIEVRFPADQKPKVTELPDGSTVVTATVSQNVSYGRGLWVKTYDPSAPMPPKDGKGFLIGPTRRLKLG